MKLSDISAKGWLLRAFLAAVMLACFFIPSQPVRLSALATLAAVTIAALIVHMRAK